MNFKTLRPVLLGASILVLGAAGAANAQPAPPPPPGAWAGQHDGGRRHMDPAEHAQRKAEHLRAALQLTPAQEPALRAFVDATSFKPGDREARRGEHERLAAMTTPERLDRMRARMDEHRARFEQHVAATKRFYAQLTPAQQKAFDALRPEHMRGHGMHRGPGPFGRG